MAMLTKGHAKCLIARDKEKARRVKEAAKHKRLCACVPEESSKQNLNNLETF